MSDVLDLDQRAAATEALFARATTTTVSLPTLSDEAEFILGGGQWALTDAAAWRAWTSLEQTSREHFADDVRRSLVASRLVDVGSDEDGDSLAVMAPELGIVELARTHADVLLTTVTTPPEAPPALPYGYVIRDEDAGVRGVVLELRGGGTHDYRLLSVRSAAEFFGDWLRATVQTDDWGRRYDRASVEALRCDAERPQALGIDVHLGASGVDGAALLRDGRRVRVEDASRDTVCALVETMLIEAVEAGPREDADA